MLEFLPDKVFIPESFDFNEVVEELYEIFKRDIKLSNLKYKGIRVFYDDRIIDSQYEEGFWHIIEHGKNIRTLDIKRAKRLPWIKPLIACSDNPRLLKWTEDNLNGKGVLEEVTYIYYEEESYLIILKKSVEVFIWQQRIMSLGIIGNGIERNTKRRKKRDPDVNRPLSSFYHW
jgi:hypothetical protein